MKILQRYFLSQILRSVLFVLFAFLGLFAFFDLIGELSSVGRGGYQLQHVLIYILLGFPGYIYELMPFAVLIGTIYALAMFASNSEYTIMRVSSLSTLDACWMLAKVGLADRADAYPRQLSGGQQQRVAIARALATDPEIIYFDEPTSALDPELTGEVLSVMRQLAEEGMTMLVVTHEMGFARNVSSKTVFMENGVVVEQAPSQEFFANPKEERTREFLQKISQHA